MFKVDLQQQILFKGASDILRKTHIGEPVSPVMWYCSDHIQNKTRTSLSTFMLGQVVHLVIWQQMLTCSTQILQGDMTQPTNAIWHEICLLDTGVHVGMCSFEKNKLNAS